MIYDNKQSKVPYDAYISVNNQVYDADVYIKLPTEEKFSFSNCVVIFFIIDNTDTRRYFRFDFFEVFTDKELKDINLKGYEPFGVYLFFKDSLFLESFKSSNKYII